MSQGILFTMPIVAVIDNLGVIATGGSISFFRAGNHVTPKLVYKDAALTIEWGSVITLNSIGEQPTNNLIYLLPDEPYFVQFKDQFGTILKEFDNYPYPSSTTPVIPDQNIQNFVDNPTFAYVYALPGVMPAALTPIAPGNWYFNRSNTSSTLSLTFQPFAPGQSTVPGNPPNYLHYVCSVPGSGETYTQVVIQQFDNVETFTNQSVVVDTYVRSSTNSAVELQVVQHFGEGGSPDVVTNVETYTLTSNFTDNNSIFVMPDITGMTIGPGSYVRVLLSYPTNSVATIDLGSSAIYESTKLITFQEVPSNVIYNQSFQSQYPLINFNNLSAFNPADGSYELVIAQNALAITPEARAGKGGWWPTNNVPSYALMPNGLPFHSATYYNLAQINLVEGWGTGPQGFTTSVGGDNITATCFSNGSVVSGSIGTMSSGFNFSQSSNGSSVTPGIAVFGCDAASTIIPGNYWLINSPSTSYYVWYSLNNQTQDPGPSTAALSGKIGIKVIYAGDETGAEVATITAPQLNIAHSRLPDIRGLFPRMPNFGATGVLPSTQQIFIVSAGNDSGITFAIVGLDLNGMASSETLTGANAGTATSVNSYSAITSITPSGNTASTVTAGIVGTVDGLCLTQSGTTATALIINGTFGRDPDYATRYAMYTGGATADNVGSQQQNQILSHVHPLTYQFTNVDSGGGGGPQGVSDFQSGGTTSNSGAAGGNQANPNNVNINYFIYY